MNILLRLKSRKCRWCHWYNGAYELNYVNRKIPRTYYTCGCETELTAVVL